MCIDTTPWYNVGLVAYNGELGIYSVLTLTFSFADRSGRVKTIPMVYTSEVPLRKTAWTILEGITAFFCLIIVVTEMGDLLDSLRRCSCAYFKDVWNIIDWAVVLIYALQCVLWASLEFGRYGEAFDLLIDPVGGTVTQDFCLLPTGRISGPRILHSKYVFD